MQRFHAALNTWFSDHPQTSLRSLADDAKIDPSVLSVVKSGKRQMTFAALCAILPAIERASTRTRARTLLVAYLHDETPPEYLADIRITALDKDTGTQQSDTIDQLASRWAISSRSDAEFWAMWSGLDNYVEHPEVLVRAAPDYKTAAAMASTAAMTLHESSPADTDPDATIEVEIQVPADIAARARQIQPQPKKSKGTPSGT